MSRAAPQPGWPMLCRLLAAATAVAAVLGGSARAADKPVYRCANGSYADTPCPGGSTVPVDDPRSAAQQAQARDTARRDAALARQLAAERQREEAASHRRPAPMAGIGAASPARAASAPKPAASAAKRPHRHRHTADQVAEAEAPGAGKKPSKKASAKPAASEGRMGQY